MSELPFLDRSEEVTRLERFCRRREGGLAVVFGRRRCGKSRLLREALPHDRCVWYVADAQAAALQRQALAVEIARLLPGFAQVHYPDWDALFSRWWADAAKGYILVLDEFPTLVSSAPEIPSLLQKYLDREARRGCHLVLCGSSQRMMQGLVLDRTAPLFGRAVEILKVSPLAAGWIKPALHLKSSVAAVEAYALWGGIPRYWELSNEWPDLTEAMKTLVLDPLGVLHAEPTMLLLDDVRDTAQSASILQLIGQGCHRLSEIASRLGKPATSLGRPLQRLIELGFVRRDQPLEALSRDTKRSLYRISDPFRRFWFRYVSPHRSLLEARHIQSVATLVMRDWTHHVGGIWEDLARESVVRSSWFDRSWQPASSWWGPGTDRKPLEIDVVAESIDRKALLVGSVKWEEKTDLGRVSRELEAKARALPHLAGRNLHYAVWVRKAAGTRRRTDLLVIDPATVLGVLQ